MSISEPNPNVYYKLNNVSVEEYMPYYEANDMFDKTIDRIINLYNESKILKLFIGANINQIPTIDDDNDNVVWVIVNIEVAYDNEYDSTSSTNVYNNPILIIEFQNDSKLYPIYGIFNTVVVDYSTIRFLSKPGKYSVLDILIRYLDISDPNNQLLVEKRELEDPTQTQYFTKPDSYYQYFNSESTMKLDEFSRKYRRNAAYIDDNDKNYYYVFQGVKTNLATLANLYIKELEAKYLYSQQYSDENNIKYNRSVDLSNVNIDVNFFGLNLDNIYFKIIYDALNKNLGKYDRVERWLIIDNGSDYLTKLQILVNYFENSNILFESFNTGSWDYLHNRDNVHGFIDAREKHNYQRRQLDTNHVYDSIVQLPYNYYNVIIFFNITEENKYGDPITNIFWPQLDEISKKLIKDGKIYIPLLTDNKNNIPRYINKLQDIFGNIKYVSTLTKNDIQQIYISYNSNHRDKLDYDSTLFVPYDNYNLYPMPNSEYINSYFVVTKN